MRLWRKVSGLLKDQNSIWIASLSRRTALRNPDIEAAVIKATSHDEFSMNMKNVDRVFRWLRLSPTNLKPFIWAISIRTEKTRSWVVAIKVLILMHGLYSTRLPCVQRIGRLTFDLSNFEDGHSKTSEMQGINEFIRAYFAFLDQKSYYLFMELEEKRSMVNLDDNMVVHNLENEEKDNYTMVQDLVLIQKLQTLLDMLLETKPLSGSAIVPLVLEAMDCVVTEIFDVYSRIRHGIARVLSRINSVGKVEATMALKIMKRANIQAEELSLYFEFNRDIGVRNAEICPTVDQIPEEEIKELEELINGVSDKSEKIDETDQAIAIHENLGEKKDSASKLMTIITDRWETFDEEHGGCSSIDKMSKIDALVKRICFCLIVATSLGVMIFGSSVEAKAQEFHQCNHGHGHHHHHDHGGQGHHHHESSEVKQRKLLEELAEEEDLKLYGFGSHDNMDDHHHHHHHDGHGVKDLTGLGLWVSAMGCSLLVSLASLICLILLPLIFIQGKPSKAVVDSLALFGAGAMLGDAFLHQLPHAFGGGHSHSHDDHVEYDHLHDHSSHSHAHSLEDLSIGLSILAGIVLFLIVEKLVRYVEDFSGGVNERSHGHHHHHHMHFTKLKDDNDADDDLQELSQVKGGSLSEKAAGGSGVDVVSSESPSGEKPNEGAILRKRNTGSSAAEDNTALDAANCSTKSTSIGEEQAKPRSSLVFGYLNLFSDGVHNFTDGMALGSAFLLYGSVGGWSRTLFLLAHELPQEIGDFGILVRSGFSVSKALFFNFLSALLALAGTAMALTLGQDSGHSSLIEGFTAGGFIYISVAGVLAEMNNSGRTTLVNTVIQLISLVSGMAVALCISLVE
ncbi:hypothetical protein HAX54_011927 [Datura stramonium]|uniref:ENTH domain-containing protein n=1 Tax=Datura stramonium TaxID=4076 RepID=A0ABS8TJW2_DATST|nr:hypothetical protein [Datura stramonium]